MRTVTCERCGVGRTHCLCAHVPHLANRTHVAVIRHVRERHRTSNTGRLATLALANSSLIDYGDRAGPPAPPPTLEGAWLLYPEGPVMASPPVPAPKALLVLDATWSQSRKMRQQLAWLRGLPVLHVAPPHTTRARLRNAPADGMVSTIEAIAHALGFLEGADMEAPLLALFDRAVLNSGAAARRQNRRPAVLR